MKILIISVLAAALAVSAPFILNHTVKTAAEPYIVTEAEAAGLGADCVLVLGAGVTGEELSPMLRDRVLQGVALYKNGAAEKLLMSGDHGRKEYDEVNAMKKFAMEMGVPEEDIFMDHAGFSTYESAYRAGKVFEAEKIIVVTQGYHLYRAVYDARALGLEAYGVASDLSPYKNQRYRDIREFFARNKDFFMCVFKPKPTFLGEAIPISGDGRLTDG